LSTIWRLRATTDNMRIITVARIPWGIVALARILYKCTQKNRIPIVTIPDKEVKKIYKISPPKMIRSIGKAGAINSSSLSIGLIDESSNIYPQPAPQIDPLILSICVSAKDTTSSNEINKKTTPKKSSKRSTASYCFIPTASNFGCQ